MNLKFEEPMKVSYQKFSEGILQEKDGEKLLAHLRVTLLHLASLDHEPFSLMTMQLRLDVEKLDTLCYHRRRSHEND